MDNILRADHFSRVQPIRLVVSDIDGTLIDRQGRVSEENLAAVRLLKDLGINFTLATGRMDRTAGFYIKHLAVELPVIAFNGALIRNFQTKEIFSQTTMQPQDVAYIVEWLWRHQVDYLLYSADAAYYPAYGDRVRFILKSNQDLSQNNLQPVAYCRMDKPELPSGVGGWFKFHTDFSRPELIDEMKIMLQRQTFATGAKTAPLHMDVMPRDVSKGKALRQLAEILNISLHEIAAVGDHDNDVPMLKAAGLGIAMANGSEAARQAADYITASNENSGLARAISEKILLS